MPVARPVRIRRPGLRGLAAALGAAASLLVSAPGSAAPYTVRPGDTLYGIARAFGTTPAALRSLNGLSGTGLRVGQVLEVPDPTPAAVQAGLQVGLQPSALPGEPVTVRVSGVPAGVEPTVSWGEEQLVVARDGRDWVAVGRELLGTAPKAVPVVVRAGAATLTRTVAIRPDPHPVMDLFMPRTALDSLTDANRELENRVLEAAYARRTPVAWSGTWAAPLAAASTTSQFGTARRYYSGAPVNYHYGEDFRGRTGTPVRAANDGTVVISGRYAIRGVLVGIDHGAGVVSLYMHMSAADVKVGQRVRRGDLVGRVGATGFVTGPHLHWEVRVRGEATNPLRWVGKRWP